MTLITKALIVDQPWIDLILSGAKNWEMRSTGAAHRGWFGLIRKGSGQVVGVARLTGSGQPLSAAEMVASFDRHRIPEHLIRSGAVAKWTTPWHLADARPLPNPVPYRHPFGAVTWVNLDDAAARAISTQLDLPAAAQPIPQTARPAPLPAPVRAPDHPDPPEAMLGEAVLTEGNLKNNHVYLRGFLHRFPDDLVGGRDANPPVLAVVEAAGMRPTETDICPRHLFFRDRSWTRQFLATHHAAPGDRVQVLQIAPRHYRVSLVKG